MSPEEVRSTVATAAANSYEWADAGPIQYLDNDPTMLFSSTLRRLERICVHAGEVEKLDSERIQNLRRSGTEFWVLLPLHEMGTAHSTLKHIADRIQPYWFDNESNTVKFGKEESP